MLIRLAAAAGLSMGITLGLFYMMQGLIAMADARLDDSKHYRKIEFVRMKESSELQVKKRELPNRQKPQEAPNVPQMNLDSGGPSEGPTLSVAPPTASTEGSFKPSRNLSFNAPAVADAATMPIFRVQPTYPPHAAQRGIEGWVQVSFSVTESGTVANAKVMSADPPGIFNRAALKAIAKWKYKPKIRNGKPVARHGLLIKLDFVLKK